ncbi:cupin domain-containing protein [Paraferrimonas sedimenticola]|uniref:ChrR-like cupin domain-containing protein n=1 Tax=Paraferrimonas sedimenticola TaxID=375674 RepID=A0AA37RQY3_9GAMM|nr:cupin domain-containing protein [Paraferrimonas sedimenticola]GLP95165.1 hypothetical protein GCM10007895_04710 [Paraferrimonas sedimenticola]
MDFSVNLTIDLDTQEWQDSPAPGVQRKPLEREAAEHGHATSLVRYAPGSRFSEHKHPLGEELLVLEGVFSDEHGHYVEGSYIRNPPGSAHSPYSEPGCLLFVKLQQMPAEENQTIRVDTGKQGWQTTPSQVLRQNLFDSNYEQVSLFAFDSGQSITLTTDCGCEMLLIEGAVSANQQQQQSLSWNRFGPNQSIELQAQQKSLIWLKRHKQPR